MKTNTINASMRNITVECTHDGYCIQCIAYSEKNGFEDSNYCDSSHHNSCSENHLETLLYQKLNLQRSEFN